MRITLLAIARLRGAEAEIAADYQKRIAAGFKIKELSGATQKAEGTALLAAIPEKAYVVLLDERGKDLSSREFAQKLKKWEETGPQDLVFLIGGADGVTEDVKARADFTLGMGRKTWPHKLVRVMLLEQIYRAQQINAGHPYHRD
jgi:23S rRNA (pseudouridine1915-N3)-methyltransferase